MAFYLDVPPDRVTELEHALAQDADHQAMLQEVLSYYWIHPSIEKRRPHILRLIERQPESDLAGSVIARIFAAELEPGFPGDPIGYQRARELWLAHISRPDASAKILINASAFFESSDKRLAEALLLRLAALAPQGDWRIRLGRFYAIALAGETELSGRNRTRWVTPREPGSAFGTLVRQKLGESRDEVLLTSAGWFLMRATYGRNMEFDPSYWAESCFKRALQINPRAVVAHTQLLHARRRLSNRQPLWRVPPAKQYESVAALPEDERFEELPD